MRIHTASAALLLFSISLLPMPASAQADSRAQLRLVIMDETSAPLPHAAVTIFTLDGNLGRDVTANEQGVVTVPDLPVGLTQVYARTPGHKASAEATRLKAGDNARTVTLESQRVDSSSAGLGTDGSGS